MSILLSLLGCPAEDLGIELPPGGVDAIGQEDLRRDVRIVAEQGEDGFFVRMDQMHARRDGDCAVRGDGEPLRLVAGDTYGRAALISLAKGLDTAESTRAVAFCWTGEGTEVRLVPVEVGGVPDWRAAEADVRATYTRLLQ